jgi:hypothetical protein
MFTRPEAAIAGLIGAGAMMSSDDADAGVLSKAKGLLMDTPSRMARAKEQGFDVDAPMYHGSSKGGYNDTHDIKAFDLDKAGDKWNQDEGGFFFTSNPEEANYYATTDSTGRTVNGAVYPTFLKTKKPLIIDSKNDPDLASEQGVGYWDNRHEELMKKARDGGYDSIRLIDRGAYEDGYDVMSVVLEPENIRSPNAAFDPAKAGSSSLLASNPVATTGAGLLGLGAAAQSNDTYADYSPSNLARLQSNDVGGYQAPQHPRLASAAMGAEQVNERGVDDALMQFLAPRLPSELMSKIAYNDERGLLDRIKASAGLLGFY